MRVKIAMFLAVVAFVLGSWPAQGQDRSSERPVALSERPITKARPVHPDTYGSAQVSYYRIPSSEFTGLNLGDGFDNWQDRYYSAPGTPKTFARYGNHPLKTWLAASPHLPSGAQITFIEIPDCSSADGSVKMELWQCDFFGHCGTAPVQTVSAAAGCGSDAADVSSLGLTVDNNANEYVFKVSTTTDDGTDYFSGVVVGYVLHVSPAPVTATFTDVPTSDFAFQFIEAFSAAGITVGCNVSPPQFCPDRNVTRREMAVFFAKALGLEFQ
jgi:hypothetical protein